MWHAGQFAIIGRGTKATCVTTYIIVGFNIYRCAGKSEFELESKMQNHVLAMAKLQAVRHQKRNKLASFNMYAVHNTYRFR